jgi:cytochrome bd-type quinol oxidase subunit 2
MSDWLLNLPVVWMAVVIFGAAYLFAAALYRVITTLASGERARVFKAVSPGMLPPLAIVFALLVGFLAAQVWSDADRANTAVNREALQTAPDARRQRILLSRSSVNWVKWTALLIQAGLTLTTIAMIHADNRATNRIILTIFATGVAVAVVLIAAHSRPFIGELSVSPSALLQVMPEATQSPAAP